MPVSPETFIIRIGRHSGAECLTINGHRNIRIIRGLGQPPLYLDHATTLWLASDYPTSENKKALIPFGWIQLSEITDEIEQEFDRVENDWQKAQLMSQQAAEMNVTKTAEIPVQAVTAESVLEKLLKELSVIKSIDAGRLAQVIQKIETLPTDLEKGQLAKAIKEKMGPDLFKKSKYKQLLTSWVEKAFPSHS